MNMRGGHGTFGQEELAELGATLPDGLLGQRRLRFSDADLVGHVQPSGIPTIHDTHTTSVPENEKESEKRKEREVGGGEEMYA
jgi:hypothetical protein